MKKHYYILLYILFGGMSIWANTNPKDSTDVKQKIVSKTVYTDLAHLDETVKTLSGQYGSTVAANTSQFRSFPEPLLALV